MKQRTRIFIYILVAIAVVILGGITIINNHQTDKPASAQEHIDFGRIYLADLSWEKAVLEFTEAIEIEPLNADAYLGLAEAYVGIRDMDKAIEVLEEGYDKTGDERLKDMLEELQPPVPEETTVVTTKTTITTVEETSTVSTAAMVTVPDLSGLTEEEAIAACESVGLQYSVSYDYSDVVEKGYVIGQSIPVSSSVAKGISVPFTVSDGVKVVTTVATTVETTASTIEKKDCTVKIYTHMSTYYNGEKRSNEDYPYKEITYDSNGHVTKTVEYFNRGYSHGPDKLILEYDDKNNIYKSRIFDKDGNDLIIGYGNKYFNLDYKNIYDNNHIIMTELTDPQKVYIYSSYYQVYMYNSLGQCTDKVTIDSNPFNDYTPDSYMKLVSSLTNSSSSYYMIEKWEHYEYNSNGKVIKEFGFNQVDDYNYDTLQGYWAEILKPRYREFYNYNDSLESEGIKKESYVYDNSTGVLASIQVFKPDNDTDIPYYIKWLDNADIVYNFTYGKNYVLVTNSNNKMTTYSLNGLDKKYINSINYLIDYIYDSDGQLIKETKYDFNILEGFSLNENIEYKYDSNGDLIMEKSTSSYGSVYEHSYSYNYIKK